MRREPSDLIVIFNLDIATFSRRLDGFMKT